MNRKLNYLKKIIYSSFWRLKFPHKISYVLTYRCNLRCKMCNIWKKEPEQELGIKEIERFFKISNQFSWVGITGGEAFLREDISDVIRVILGNCQELVAIHFASNGTMTDRIVEVVKDALKHVHGKTKLLFTLSIDGPPDLHDKIRGRDGTWDKCMETFKRLKKIDAVKPRLGVTLSNHNLDKFQELFTSLKKADSSLCFDDITINMFHKSSSYYDNDSMPELDVSAAIEAINAILKMDKDYFTINNFLRRKYLMLYKQYAKNKKCPLKCQALSATCILDPRGDIYPCGIYGKRIANIKEYDCDLNKLWADPWVREMSRQCSRNICPSCWSPCDAYSAIGSSLFNFNLWRGR
jgi:radical SAM protein with 4Fe4S-binding SPASM domain